MDKNAKPVVNPPRKIPNALKNKELCLDPRELNKSILKDHFPMKTVEEVAVKVKNAKIYSVLDASNGYWQIRLTKDSQKYTTFNSPFG